MGESSYVAEASRCLLAKGFAPDAIAEALGILGRGARVDRVYIFEDEVVSVGGERVTSQRYEWVAPGIAPQIDDPACQRMPYRTFGAERAAHLLRGDAAMTLTRETQPASFRRILASQGIQSLLLCPIVHQRSTWGFVGFDDCHSERHWPAPELTALRGFARAMTAALRQAGLSETLGLARTQLRKIL